ncbi:DUF4065 domain-containing protein [Pseudomonas viridiflava]|uniref:Panacea domain-containing protein n=1 Tax=Pseudomonas viridiflava TaxID=33069 RepID=UPI0018E5E8E8|nr:type II toxin-antitoxin system antitoxin SocA domain-containing protein [Pseudomonas viridiflava]MBI6727496.1 DUF4065 domain-containing protein [Pseudomonas viridiflava]
MSKKSLAVAQLILELSSASPRPCVTPMKLLKLTYIAHGYMMGRHRKPLLDEDIQAYQYGPIIKSVHNKVRYYGSSPVLKIKGASAWKGQFTTQEYEIIREVVSLYGAHTALTLSAAMHHPSTPWSITREYANGDAPISNDLIGIFYSKLLEEPAHRYL